jgi:hypothetical protein
MAFDIFDIAFDIFDISFDIAFDIAAIAFDIAFGITDITDIDSDTPLASSPISPSTSPPTSPPASPATSPPTSATRGRYPSWMPLTTVCLERKTRLASLLWLMH